MQGVQIEGIGSQRDLDALRGDAGASQQLAACSGIEPQVIKTQCIRRRADVRDDAREGKLIAIQRAAVAVVDAQSSMQLSVLARGSLKSRFDRSGWSGAYQAMRIEVA